MKKKFKKIQVARLRGGPYLKIPSFLKSDATLRVFFLFFAEKITNVASYLERPPY